MAKSIIITGAGRGIGASTAHAFLNAGYRVGLIGLREKPTTTMFRSQQAQVTTSTSIRSHM